MLDFIMSEKKKETILIILLLHNFIYDFIKCSAFTDIKQT